MWRVRSFSRTYCHFSLKSLSRNSRHGVQQRQCCSSTCPPGPPASAQFCHHVRTPRSQDLRRGCEIQGVRKKNAQMLRLRVPARKTLRFRMQQKTLFSENFRHSTGFLTCKEFPSSCLEAQEALGFRDIGRFGFKGIFGVLGDLYGKGLRQMHHLSVALQLLVRALGLMRCCRPC